MISVTKCQGRRTTATRPVLEQFQAKHRHSGRLLFIASLCVAVVSPNALGQRVAESEHYRIENEGSALSDAEVLEVSEATFKFLEETLAPSRAFKERMQVRVLGTRAAFAKAVVDAGGTPESAEAPVGKCMGRARIALVLDSGTKRDTRETLIHEAVHLFLSERGRKGGAIPHWANEGLARVVAEHRVGANGRTSVCQRGSIITEGAQEEFIDAMASGNGPRLNSIIIGAAVERDVAAWAAVKFVLERKWTLPSVREWFQGLVLGAEPKLPTTATGLPQWLEWEAEFREFVSDMGYRWVFSWGLWEAGQEEGSIIGSGNPSAVLRPLVPQWSGRLVHVRVIPVEGSAGIRVRALKGDESWDIHVNGRGDVIVRSTEAGGEGVVVGGVRKEGNGSEFGLQISRGEKDEAIVAVNEVEVTRLQMKVAWGWKGLSVRKGSAIFKRVECK